MKAKMNGLSLLTSNSSVMETFLSIGSFLTQELLCIFTQSLQAICILTMLNGCDTELIDLRKLSWLCRETREKHFLCAHGRAGAALLSLFELMGRDFKN